jgi:hypothetical protein
MSKKQPMVPVWFFIGVLLTAYGIIILITSVLQRSHPGAVEFGKYHTGLWGGILLTLIGGFYTLRFWPRNVTTEQ